MPGENNNDKIIKQFEDTIPTCLMEKWKNMAHVVTGDPIFLNDTLIEELDPSVPV